MLQTVEAIVEKNGQVRLLEQVDLSKRRRALVTILDESADDYDFSGVGTTAPLSEAALSKDWNRPEEDEAWSHLQPERSS